MADRPEFRVVAVRPIAEHAFLRLEELEVAAGGESVRRLRVYHPGAVALVAVDGDDVVLIRQYRAPAEQDLLEIPAGTLDVDGEHVEEAAARELQEETGFRPGSLRHLFDFFTAPGFTNEFMRLYLATDLEPAEPDPDGPEEAAAEIVRVPVAAIPDLLASGEIADAKTLVGLQWLVASDL